MPNFVGDYDKLMHHMGMVLEEATPQYARVRMPLTEELKNGMGIAHGGAIFALADVAFGAAANADGTNGVVTLNTSIEYLRPGIRGPFVAEARLVRGGQQIQSYDVKVYDSKGEMIARAQATGFRTETPLASFIPPQA